MKIEIDIPDGFYFDKNTMTVKEYPNQEFEYVDLGLPSGTLLAKCNIGAKKDINFGDYFNFEPAQKYNCPSKEQIEELKENTTSLWIVKDDVFGRLLIGKNGNYIFLPAAGYYFNDSLRSVDSLGCYWSSTPCPHFPYCGNSIDFSSEYIGMYNGDCYYNKLTVRPVSK